MFQRIQVIRDLFAAESIFCYCILIAIVSLLRESWESHWAVLLLGVVGAFRVRGARRLSENENASR